MSSLRDCSFGFTTLDQRLDVERGAHVDVSEAKVETFCHQQRYNKSYIVLCARGLYYQIMFTIVRNIKEYHK